MSVAKYFFPCSKNLLRKTNYFGILRPLFPLETDHFFYLRQHCIIVMTAMLCTSLFLLNLFLRF